MDDKKFSQFLPAPASPDDVKRGDIVVGLRDGKNYQFDFPGTGIKDANGNYFFRYVTAGVSAVNYPEMINSLSGTPVIYGANGIDPNIKVWIRPHGNAGVKIDDLNFPLSDGPLGAVMVTDGAANLSLQPIASLIAVRGTANQVLVNGTSGTYLTGNLTLTTPQNIAPSSSPTFFSMSLSNPLTVINGGTGVNAFLANGILYASNPATISQIPVVNNAMIVTNSTGIPSLTTSMTNGQIVIGSTGASPAPNTISGGPGISITNGPGTITISAIPGGMTWTEVTGTSQAMSADNGYIANNAGIVTLTLPTIAALGTFIRIIGKGAGGWTIAQNAGQNIQIGNTSSTVGAAGLVTSSNRYDSVHLVCTTANTTWTALGAPQSAGLNIA